MSEIIIPPDTEYIISDPRFPSRVVELCKEIREKDKEPVIVFVLQGISKAYEDVVLIREFIEKWLDKDHGEHAEMSMVQDMKLLLTSLDDTMEINEDSQSLKGSARVLQRRHPPEGGVGGCPCSFIIIQIEILK